MYVSGKLGDNGHIVDSLGSYVWSGDFFSRVALGGVSLTERAGFRTRILRKKDGSRYIYSSVFRQVRSVQTQNPWHTNRNDLLSLSLTPEVAVFSLASSLKGAISWLLHTLIWQSLLLLQLEWCSFNSIWDASYDCEILSSATTEHFTILRAQNPSIWESHV